MLLNLACFFNQRPFIHNQKTFFGNSFSRFLQCFGRLRMVRLQRTGHWLFHPVGRQRFPCRVQHRLCYPWCTDFAWGCSEANPPPARSRGVTEVTSATTYFRNNGPTNFDIFRNFSADRTTFFSVDFSRATERNFSYTADYSHARYYRATDNRGYSCKSCSGLSQLRLHACWAFAIFQNRLMKVFIYQGSGLAPITATSQYVLFLEVIVFFINQTVTV